MVYLRFMYATVSDLIAFFLGYGLQALLFCAAMLVIVLVGLPVLLAIRAGWRRVSPYEPPSFGAVPSLRDRLERL